MKRQSVLALLASAVLSALPRAAEIKYQGFARHDPFNVAEFCFEGEITDADVENAKAALARTNS